MPNRPHSKSKHRLSQHYTPHTGLERGTQLTAPSQSSACWCHLLSLPLRVWFFLSQVMSKARLSSKGKALEASLREKRMVNTGTQCGKQALASTASNHQRRPRRSITDVGVTGSRYKHVWPFHVMSISFCLVHICGIVDLTTCHLSVWTPPRCWWKAW